MSGIYLLSGEMESGKTSLCLEVIELARRDGIHLGGVASPGVFDGGVKIAIDLLDIRSGKRRRLADLLGDEKPEIATQRWAFLPEAVAWGNQILKTSIPCDLLVIDELGPLEFQHGEGWISALEILGSNDFRSALVVVRPSLLDEALKRWDVERIIRIDDPGEEYKSGQVLFQDLVRR